MPLVGVYMLLLVLVYCAKILYEIYLVVLWLGFVYIQSILANIVINAKMLFLAFITTKTYSIKDAIC